jgi:zinc transport system substrate-binding protein
MRLLLLWLGLVLALAQPGRAEPPRVVADIPPVHSLAAMVMDGIATPALLLDTAASPHQGRLRPSQARALSRADAVFRVGDALTPWLGRAFSGLAEGAVPVVLLEAPGTRLRRTGGGATDPHAWLDPQNAIVWVRTIAETLSALDPDNAATYRANAGAAVATIEAAMKRARERLAPARALRLVFSHDAFGYFTARFGLRTVGTIAEGDAAAPGAARLAVLGRMAREGGIDCLLIEPGTSPALAGMIAAQADIPIAEVDPLGLALPAGASLYPRLILDMADTIAGCAR